MAKKIVGFIKLQVPAGKANPSPPIGPALGQRGLNIMEFCKAFNAQTQGVEPGLPLPAPPGLRASQQAQPPLFCHAIPAVNCAQVKTD